MKPIPAIIIGLMFVLLVGLAIDNFQLQAELKQQDYIPSPTDIQQLLVSKGYEIEVDGIVGRQTLAAWDKALCQQYAGIYINNETMGVEK